MAYDPQRGVTVLLGSENTSDTYEWAGNTWSSAGSGGPPAFHTHRMVFDSGRGRLVMVDMAAGMPPVETWEWINGKWQLRNLPNVPAPRSDFALAYDEQRHVTVLFGGRYFPSVVMSLQARESCRRAKTLDAREPLRRGVGVSWRLPASRVQRGRSGSGRRSRSERRPFGCGLRSPR